MNPPKSNVSNDAGRALTADADRAGSERFMRAATGLVSVLLLLTLSAAWLLVVRHDWQGALDLVQATFSSHVFWTAVAVGLFAQIVDGALGMAYGVTASTFLMAAGASPATASASVHIAEIFTTGVSGVAHARRAGCSAWRRSGDTN